MSLDHAIALARRVCSWTWAPFRRHLAPRRGLRVRWDLDMPPREDLRQGELVVVGTAEHPKWLTFHCPCGCSTPLLLSLHPRRRPRWAVSLDPRGRPSVTPSVRRTDGCLSHFWIHGGRIYWCGDTGRLERMGLAG